MDELGNFKVKGFSLNQFYYKVEVLKVLLSSNDNIDDVSQLTLESYVTVFCKYMETVEKNFKDHIFNFLTQLTASGTKKNEDGKTIADKD